MTDKDKMLSGMMYISSDETLVKERQSVREMLYKYNHTYALEVEERNKVMRNIVKRSGKNFHIEPPFYCDYGYNIEFGDNFYANFNCVILDCASVVIGDDVFFAPNVNIYTAGHPVDWVKRRAGLEFAEPIRIGNNVWIGGNTVINPGVSIGNGTVIGSGSVVTQNIPSGVVAVGNPCRVVKKVIPDAT